MSFNKNRSCLYLKDSNCLHCVIIFINHLSNKNCWVSPWPERKSELQLSSQLSYYFNRFLPGSRYPATSHRWRETRPLLWRPATSPWRPRNTGPALSGTYKSHWLSVQQEGNSQEKCILVERYKCNYIQLTSQYVYPYMYKNAIYKFQYMCILYG